MIQQRFSRPDFTVALCGHLDCAVTETVIPGAPEFMRKLRAVFVTDVHATARTTEADFARLLGRVQALSPDIVLLGGDYADEAAHAERFFHAFAGLRAPLGCYGVIGNNDSEAWEDPSLCLRRVMEDAGCRLLLNQSRKIDLEGGRLIIGGVDEMKYGTPSMRRLFPRKNGDDYRILLSHFPILPEKPPDLILSGHTHGGQFNLLGITPYSIGFEYASKYADMPRVNAGLFAEGGARLLVSKGIGASRIPLRIGVRPEINLLRFSE